MKKLALTWSFFEAGHGRSSAEGAGGNIKRRADLAVSYDILSADSFIKVLYQANIKVKLFEVTAEEVNSVETSGEPNPVPIY